MEAEEASEPSDSPIGDAQRSKELIRTIVERAAATLSVEYPGQFGPTDMYRVLRTYVQAVVPTVQRDMRAASEAGTEWTEVDVENAFYTQILSRGRTAMRGRFGELGYRLIDAKGGSTGYAGMPSTDSDGTPSAAAIVGSLSSGTCGTLVLCLNSSDRSGWSGTQPNLCRFSLGADAGIAYEERSISQIKRIVLRGVNINAAPLFTERPDGATFYIGIDEVANTYNRESSMNDKRGHFECFAEANASRSGLRVQIVTGTIDMPITSLDLSIITFRFYDDIKRPLVLEQDLYSIQGYAWDDVGERLILTVGQHYIRTSDRIVIRNYYFSQDRSLLDDAHDFRAEVVSNTQIAIYAWRAALPPGTPPDLIPPEGDRTPTADGPYIIDLNNNVRITIAIDYIRT